MHLIGHQICSEAASHAGRKERLMNRRKRKPEPKIKPWAHSTFALKTHWEDWGTDEHFWAHLERRAPGKFGRLQVMHAIVPSSRRQTAADTLFGSARYRKITLDGAREVFQQAGVPDQQAKDFMETIVKKYPYPTDEDLFVEQISSPLVAMALGERRKNLSYYRTGVPEFTRQDMQLFKECLKELDVRIKASPEDREKFLDVAFRRGFL
jgi:hypothetical protein